MSEEHCRAELRTNVNPDLLAKIERKRKEREESFTKLRGTYTLDEKAKSIVQLPTRDLLQKLQSRSISAKEVLEAYIAKALEVTDKFNCVTEFIPKALEWASRIDSLPANQPPLPLHGLPVAIKEDHDVEGMDTTLGYAKLLYKPAKESSVLVKSLLRLGAVPFAKTNIPQSLFSNGSENPIFGRTSNSLNPKLTPGGSSSGSGCLVAGGGAPFATGSDLGGSLRIPAHSHGICSMRPTINRLSGKGVLQCIPDIIPLPGVPGIIAPDVETLVLVWKSITGDNLQNQYDPLAMPIPWNDQLFSSEKKLKIGCFTTLSLFPSFEDTRLTVVEAKKAFEARGHTVVDFEMPDPFHFLSVLCDLYLADQGKYLKEIFDGEPVSCCVQDLIGSLRESNTSTAENGEGGNEDVSDRDKVITRNGEDVNTACDLLKVLKERRAVTLDVLERMERAGIDLILCPSYPFPAVRMHDGHRLHGFVYSGVWNLVDFPAGVVPFGKESGKNWDNYDDQGDPVLKRAKEAIRESKGMPITVQLVARPFKEELVLKAMNELEQFKRGQ